jgi:adenine-specific DNA-methyltransferase
VLVLADGYRQGPVDHCELLQVRAAEDLATSASAGRLWKPATADSKWTPSLMSSPALAAYVGMESSPGFTTMSCWGETTLGMVTGNNRFFTMSPAQASELGLQPGDLLAVSPPGSRHLRHLTFRGSAYAALGAAGSATVLFRPAGEPSLPARAYIEAGERLSVDAAYKCRVRSPWWRVPLVKPAELLLTYMNADTPRLCTNRAEAHHLNSVHGIYLQPALRRLGMNLLPLASLNSMTMVGAEIVGRAYGGGLLKLEPKEADRLPVPAPDLLHTAGPELSAIRLRVAALLRRPDGLLEASKLVDEILLAGSLGLASGEIKALREAHIELAARRKARGRSQPRP